MTTVPSTTNGTNTNTNTNANNTKLNANFDVFLKMLTAQLQYQDPLEPTDTAQFTNQLVMYSQVEQQIAGNDKLDQMIALQQRGSFQTALNYLGYFVQSSSPNLPLQNGSSYFNVNLEKDAAKVTVSIYDSQNQLVKTFTDTGKKGDQTYNWDGTNTQN